MKKGCLRRMHIWAAERVAEVQCSERRQAQQQGRTALADGQRQAPPGNRAAGTQGQASHHLANRVIAQIDATRRHRCRQRH